jgi:hypothetical protein
VAADEWAAGKLSLVAALHLPAKDKHYSLKDYNMLQWIVAGQQGALKTPVSTIHYTGS